MTCGRLIEIWDIPCVFFVGNTVMLKWQINLKQIVLYIYVRLPLRESITGRRLHFSQNITTLITTSHCADEKLSIFNSRSLCHLSRWSKRLWILVVIGIGVMKVDEWCYKRKMENCIWTCQNTGTRVIKGWHSRRNAVEPWYVDFRYSMLVISRIKVGWSSFVGSIKMLSRLYSLGQLFLANLSIC